MERRRLWQTTIWVEKERPEPVVLYGETPQDLVEVARKWLLENKPKHFSNVDPATYSDRYRRFYQVKVGEIREANSLGASMWTTDEGFARVVERFVQEDIVIHRGPDYVALKTKPFRLEDVKTVRREHGMEQVNEMLERGWHIIAIEFSGRADDENHLVERGATFVMGNRHEDAI